MNNDKVNVIEVFNGDWNENYMCDGKGWEYWSEWYGVKSMVESNVDSGEYNNSCGFESDVNWLEICKEVEVEWSEGYRFYVGVGEYSEFGKYCFNVDLMLKSGLVVSDLEMKSEYGSMFDKDGNEFDVCSGNGEYEDGMKYLVVSNSEWDCFRLMLREEYENLCEEFVKNKES